MDNVLGKRIELERTKLGLNQIELAKRLNLSSSASISQYESGERTPSDDIKIKMAELFNCTLDYLMGKSDIRNPEKVNIDDADVAFATGVKALNETNKMIIKGTLEALLAKQEQDKKDKEDK